MGIARRRERLDTAPGVAELRSRADFMALAAEWDALADEVAPDQPFHRHAFLRVWLDNFAPRADVRVLTQRDGSGALIAVLPLVRRPTSMFGIPLTEISAAANEHSCRFELLARDRAIAAPALLSHLLATKDWELLRLVDVPDGGAGWALLESAHARGFRCGTWISQESPTIALPTHWDSYQERIGAKFRANLRRRRRKLEERGTVTLERFTGGPQLAHRLEEAFALEASGWKGSRGTAMAQSPETRGFYTELARTAALDGSLVLFFLRVDGRAVAFHYALVQRGKYFLLKPGYEESLSECSPGQLLMEDVLEDCIERGYGEFDFLGPDMVWKRDWTNTTRRHRWLYVFRGGALGRTLHTAKFRVLPTAKEALARWMR